MRELILMSALYSAFLRGLRSCVRALHVTSSHEFFGNLLTLDVNQFVDSNTLPVVQSSRRCGGTEEHCPIGIGLLGNKNAIRKWFWFRHSFDNYPKRARRQGSSVPVLFRQAQNEKEAA